jgi:hypothetical protein
MKELERMLDEWTASIEAQDWNKASSCMNSIWMIFHILATANTRPDLKELNFFKVPVTTNEGGQYLLSLVHVDGPKIQLQDGSTISAEIPTKNESV